MLSRKSLHPETERHVRRLSSPSDDYIHDLDKLIRALNNTSYAGRSIWSRLQYLFVAADTESNSIPDIVRDSVSAIPVGSPGFTADRGWLLRSTAEYIRTQFTPGADNNNNISMFVYNTDTPSPGVARSNGYGIGSHTDYAGGVPLGLWMGEEGVSITYKNLADLYTTPNINSSYGFNCATRRSSSDVSVVVDGLIATGSVAALGYGANNEVFVGCQNRFSVPSFAHPGSYAAFGGGYGLTVSEMSALNFAIQAYFEARGTAA